MLQKVYEEHKRSVDLRFQELTKRADGLHSSIHDLRNKVTAMPVIVQRIEEIVADLEKTPRKQDLEHLTQIVTAKLDAMTQERKEQAVKSRWLIGIFIAVGFPIVMLLLNILAKKLGWL